MAVCERGRDRAVDGRTKGRLIIVIISGGQIQIVPHGVFHTGPEYVEQLVAGIEGRAVDVGVIDGGAAGAHEISRDIGETGAGSKGSAGRRIPNEFISGEQL